MIFFILFASLSLIDNSDRKVKNARELNEKRNDKTDGNKKDSTNKFITDEGSNIGNDQEKKDKISNLKKKDYSNRKRSQKKNQDSIKELQNNMNKLKAGMELLKMKNNYNQKNNYGQDSQNKAYPKNKMAQILDQIRERYAQPTTPVSRITFGNVILTLVVILLIVALSYYMFCYFCKRKSSEINDEELPFMYNQLNQEQHDLSVHGFSKI